MSKTRADFLLLLAAAFWGFGNVAQKTVLEHLDPMSAVGLRCLIGGLLVLPLIALEQGAGRRSARYWRSLAGVSVLFALAMLIQQVAYLSTSVTNASFLVNTATVMTPLAAWLILGDRPTAVVGIAAIATLLGALLLSGGVGGLSHGDVAAVLSAACYALWMVELGRHMQAYGQPITAAAAQFFGAAVLALPLGALHGKLSLAAAIDAGPELMVLGVFSTALAFGFQTIAQRYTAASHAAVIVSAESVFGALGGALFLGERLAPTGLLGAALVLGAIIYLATAASAKVQAAPVARSAVAGDR